MDNISANVKETVAYLRENGIATLPEYGIVLGTGLGAFTNEMEILKSFEYSEIPGFVQSTVEFHKGQLHYGKIANKYVLVMQGRFHYYEGYSMQQITYPIRVMKALGVQYLLLSNAAGGMNKSYKKGDLVVVTDHINLLPDNPLRGLSDPALGPRFTDMSDPYSDDLNTRLRKAADEVNIKIKLGQYVAVMGPNLETRAEYRWLHSMGADMVGMSTVPEVIVANQIGLPCAAISVITDECDPDNLRPVDIAEIISVATEADRRLARLWVKMLA